MVCGVGTNDYEGKVFINGKNIISYSVWVGLLNRCYNKKHKHYKYYGARGVIVHQDWLSFKTFKEWFDKHYIEGYQLDKDILGGGKRTIYGPETCCFINSKDNFKEAVSRRDNAYLKNRTGEKHHRSKSIKWYAENPVFRCAFKRTCNRRGWKFDDFIEEHRGYHEKNGYKTKKFVYKIK